MFAKKICERSFSTDNCNCSTTTTLTTTTTTTATAAIATQTAVTTAQLFFNMQNILTALVGTLELATSSSNGLWQQLRGGNAIKCSSTTPGAPKTTEKG